MAINSTFPFHPSGSDDLLVFAARAGEEDAFGLLAERHQARLFRVAHRLLRNHEDAEDVVQNSLAKAFENLSGFRGESQFRTWIMRIVLNDSIMLLRKRQKAHPAVYLDATPDSADERPSVPLQLKSPSLNPEQVLKQSEQRHYLQAAIDRLKAPLRMVFLMREVQGLSTSETSSALGISVALVKTRLLRARRKLQLSLHSIYRSQQPKAQDATQRGRAA